jgi:hypothetical protein
MLSTKLAGRFADGHEGESGPNLSDAVLAELVASSWRQEATTAGRLPPRDGEPRCVAACTWASVAQSFARDASSYIHCSSGPSTHAAVWRQSAKREPLANSRGSARG